jgi:hypothetical protein
MLKRALCRILGHRWRAEYLKSATLAPLFYCARCGAKRARVTIETPRTVHIAKI